MSNEAPSVGAVTHPSVAAIHPAVAAAIKTTSSLSIWSLIGLAFSIASAVPQFLAIFHTPGPILGSDLTMAAMPVILGLQGALHIQIPMELVSKLADAAAEIIDQFKKTPLPPPTA